MTDLDALRAAVQQSPHDWTPRLVLADYLDDHGTEPHHAEEVARIRQAHDPSTPLGRAVAASRRAWGKTVDNSPDIPTPSTAKSNATRGERYLHTMLHNPDRAARKTAAYALLNTHERYIPRHNRYADIFAPGPTRRLHEGIASDHGEAGMHLREYARTL